MKINNDLEKYRFRYGPFGSNTGDNCGMFIIPGPCGIDLRIISSPGNADTGILWEHVSVSCESRCPNWVEMCMVKSLFWDPEDTILQFHPPLSRYINIHPYCLHLWKPPYHVELPPEACV
jgi:hypothetical protein